MTRAAAVDGDPRRVSALCGGLLIIVSLSTDNGVSPLVGSWLESFGSTGLLGTPAYLSGLVGGLIASLYGYVLSGRRIVMLSAVLALLSIVTVVAGPAWVIGAARIGVGVCAGVLLGGFLPFAKAVVDERVFGRIVALWPFAGGVASLVVPLYAKTADAGPGIRYLWLVFPVILGVGVLLLLLGGQVNDAGTENAAGSGAPAPHLAGGGWGVTWRYLLLTPSMFAGVFAALVGASAALMERGETVGVAALPPSLLAVGMIGSSLVVALARPSLSLGETARAVAVAGAVVLGLVAAGLVGGWVPVLLGAMVPAGAVFGFAVMIPGLYVAALSDAAAARRASAVLMLGQQAAAVVGSAAAVACGAWVVAASAGAMAIAACMFVVGAGHPDRGQR